MRALVQRSLVSSVEVDGNIVGKIERGLVVFVAFTYGDTIDDINYIVKKIVNLRIFDDDDGVMNLSVKDVQGEVLSVSQFTLYANTKKGNRPSYIDSLNRSDAIKLYDTFNLELKKCLNVETGIFGADMKVSITNDGPVTIIIDSEVK